MLCSQCREHGINREHYSKSRISGTRTIPGLERAVELRALASALADRQSRDRRPEMGSGRLGPRPQRETVRTLCGMQGSQLPTEPVFQPVRANLSGLQEGAHREDTRDAPSVSPHGGPLSGARLELVRLGRELSNRASWPPVNRAIWKRAGQAAATQQGQPQHTRGRPCCSRLACSRERQPALDAERNCRPLLEPGAATSRAKPCPREQGGSAPSRPGVSGTAPARRLPRSGLRGAPPGLARSV